MGLYRNIAGIPDNKRVGLSFYGAPSLSLINIDSGSSSILPSPFTDPVAYQQQQADADTAYRTEMIARYDWLMSHSYQDITAAGYYVTTDNGSIFQWTDKAAGNSVSYLSLDWIQQIENERGTAGALLMHMQEPALAKDTAGFEGGASGTWYDQNGADPAAQVVSDPISEVQSLPPVIATDSGVNFEAPNYSTTTTTSTTPTTPTTPIIPIPLPADMATALKNNLVPIAVLAGLAVVAVGGDALLHNRKKIVFVGGLGALFYLMAKKA